MRTASRPKGITRNVIANWAAFLYVAIVGFLLSPIVVNTLGATAYGVWSLLVAVVGYLGLLDFGVRGAVTRFVARYHAAGDDEQSCKIVSAAIVLFGLLGAASILLAAAIAYLSPSLFNIPGSLIADTRMVLALGGLTVAITLVGAVFGGIVTGLERFDVSSGIEIVLTTARAAAVLCVLKLGYGLVALGVVHLLIALVHGVASYVAVRRLYPAIRLRVGAWLFPETRTILSFSVFLSAIHLFAVLIYYSDVVVIAAFLPVSAATFYVIAGNLCDYAYKVAGALSKMMTPRVSALTTVASGTVVEEILGAARIATLASTAIAVTFWFRGEAFINLWMGPDFGAESAPILRVLAFVVWLGGARSIAVSSMIGVGRHRVLVPALAAEAIANVALSIALVGPLGLLGVALGTLVPSVVMSVAYVPYCLARSTGVPGLAFYRRAWLMPSLACVPFGVAGVALEHLAPAGSLTVFFCQVAATLPLVAVGALVLCLTRDEMTRVRHWCRAHMSWWR